MHRSGFKHQTRVIFSMLVNRPRLDAPISISSSCHVLHEYSSQQRNARVTFFGLDTGHCLGPTTQSLQERMKKVQGFSTCICIVLDLTLSATEKEKISSVMSKLAVFRPVPAQINWVKTTAIPNQV